ncbi:hypothetical protein ATCC90586_004502 [Pythium insidiosum]|nr:hypothetical protein ATCC90586_004502 [Pythium insidiosum]
MQLKCLYRAVRAALRREGCYAKFAWPGQDFCVTCGFWPTRVTSTNDRQGYATAALTTLAETQRRLSAAALE